MLNWGTFNKKIWKISPLGSNSLLTGDIGSGKSTLVDAITTLLVPHQKIVYNKAAGAIGKERSITSYILGEYKNERNEFGNSGKPVCLRAENDYSVLLASFFNQGYNQQVTLAQVFYLKNSQGTVKEDKFFIVSAADLTIAEDFTNFGNDILLLKKRLRALKNTEVFDTFRDYSQKFRNLFGIKSEKALDLFYQTVSMKSVGNLTEFVRNQMLERTDVKDKIDELRNNFENLTRAHEAVLKAKRQLDELSPLMDEAGEFEKINEEITELEFCLKAIPAFLAACKIALLENEIERLSREVGTAEEKIQTSAGKAELLREEEFRLKSAIENDAAGRRLTQIDKEILLLNESRTRKQEAFDEYRLTVGKLGLSPATDHDSFAEQQHQVSLMPAKLAKRLEALEFESDQLKIKKKEISDRYLAETEELESLIKRKTQIPENNLKIRERILNELALDEALLPFAGELIRVKKDQKNWEGAIERLLHNFGLSLLVPENLFKEVSAFINKTDLKGRIVFFRTTDVSEKYSRRTLSAASLINKIEIRSDSVFHDWLYRELNERFDFECCDNMDDFHRQPNALTKEGLIKSGRFRHEKDDRSNISNRRNYILGWSNSEKIRAVRNEIKLLDEKFHQTENRLEELNSEKKDIRTCETAAHDFLRIRDFSQINFVQDATEIERLKLERAKIEESSNALQMLRNQLTDVSLKIAHEEKIKEGLIVDKTRNQSTLDLYRTALAESRNDENSIEREILRTYSVKLKSMYPEDKVTISNAGQLRDKWRTQTERQKEVLNLKSRKFRDSIIRRMQNYKNDYPDDTIETDVSIEAIPDFRKFINKLKEDDLPKFKERFRELLNKGTIQDILLFKNQLDNSAADIKQKIREINRSLRDIEYEKGTYIELGLTDSADQDVKDFKAMMRVALENTLGETEPYSEQKFLRVKEILDRFNSSNQAEINWTNRVTDVRNWFIFTASEKWNEDGTEKEFYSDSSGKSGGQKEKLAYTILASALAYQFGLEWNQTKSRSLRFVVIDEAFGRGSDESTRYALELFRKLRLQLLIITPLQKINVIEDYINSVHYVSNREGNNSVVKNLTICEYREEKQNYMNQ